MAEAKVKLTSPQVVRRLLKERGLRPRRRRGQHFLCDENTLNKIVESARLHPEDLIFEIGAGLGTLTQRIAPQVRKLVAVEIDPKLIPILREQLAEYPNVRVIEADVLQLDWEELFPQGRAKTLGNLPYGITSPLIEKLIEHRALFEEALWMVQLEVAERLTAPVGTRGSSALGVLVQALFEVEKIARISKNVFFPRPEVDGALLRLAPLEEPRFRASLEAFRRVVKAAFGLRRKTILQALARSPHLRLGVERARQLLKRTGIKGTRRGETLTLEELDRLAQALEVL